MPPGRWDYPAEYIRPAPELVDQLISRASSKSSTGKPLLNVHDFTLHRLDREDARGQPLDKDGDKVATGEVGFAICTLGRGTPLGGDKPADVRLFVFLRSPCLAFLPFSFICLTNLSILLSIARHQA